MTWEFQFLDAIQTYLKNPFFDAVMPFISSLANGGLIWIVTTLILLLIKRTRRTGFCCAVALIFMLLFGNVFLKPLIARVRPFDVNTAVTLLIAAPTDFSFPSGHTFASFACACCILMDNKKLGIPALILAILIAFSRMYLYVHYPTDILGGILLGIFAAYLGHWIVKLVETKWKKRKGQI